MSLEAWAGLLAGPTDIPRPVPPPARCIRTLPSAALRDPCLFFLRGVIPAWCNKISIHWKTQWQILLAATPKSIAILLYYDIWKIVTEIVIKQILQKARQSDRRNSYPPFFSDHTLWKSMITWITRSRCPVEQSIDRVPQQMTRDIICYDSVSVITCRTA